jgi:hypothetical protein
MVDGFPLARRLPNENHPTIYDPPAHILDDRVLRLKRPARLIVDVRRDA